MCCSSHCPFMTNFVVMSCLARLHAVMFVRFVSLCDCQHDQVVGDMQILFTLRISSFPSKGLARNVKTVCIVQVVKDPMIWVLNRTTTDTGNVSSKFVFIPTHSRYFISVVIYAILSLHAHKISHNLVC